MSDSIERMTEKKTPKSLIFTVLFLLLVVAGGIAFYKLYEREKPQVSFSGDISNFGLEKELHQQWSIQRRYFPHFRSEPKPCATGS